MKNKRLFASIMAVAMMLSSLPMTAAGMVSATDEAPAVEAEYDLNLDFSTDVSSSFTHGARDISVDDGTNNDGDAFLHVSAITTGNGLAVDTNLVYTPGETITLEPGKYAFTIDMRHGYDAAYTITGNFTDAAVKKDAEAADMEMTYASAASNFRNIWIRPLFADISVVDFGEGSGTRSRGSFATLVWDDTTPHGKYGGTGDDYPDLFLVDSDWTTATSIFTVTATTDFTGFQLNSGNDGVNYTYVDSYDVDNITIERIGDVEEPGNSVKSITDYSAAYSAGNSYLVMYPQQTNGGINIIAEVAEGVTGSNYKLYADVTTGALILKDSASLRTNYTNTAGIKVRLLNNVYVDVADRSAGWTTVELGEFATTTYQIWTNSSAYWYPILIDNIRLVDVTTGETVATQAFSSSVVDGNQIHFFLGEYGDAIIQKRGTGADLYIGKDEAYDVAAFNGEANVYEKNEVLTPGIYTVTATVRNEAVVTATAVTGVNDGGYPCAKDVTDAIVAADGGDDYYRYYYGPSEIYLHTDNNKVNVDMVASFNKDVVGDTTVSTTVDSLWTDVSFTFTVYEETTLEDITFTAEPTIADSSVNYPKSLAYVGIKNVEVEKIGDIALLDGFYFPTAASFDDIANRTAGNKYVRVSGFASGVNARNTGFNFAFENVTEAAAGMTFEFDIANDVVVKQTAAATQDSYNATSAVRQNTAAVNIARTQWTTLRYDFGAEKIYMQAADSAYGLVDWAIDNVRLVDASGNVVATETFDSDNFSVDGQNITVTFPGYGTVKFNGTVSAGSVSLETAESYFTAVATDAAGNEILSDASTETLTPGIYEFTALVKNNEVVQSATVVGTSADATGVNATSAWRDNDGNGAVEYSKNDNTLAKEWIAGYIAKGANEFYRYLSQTTEWKVAKDNNKINVAPIVKLNGADDVTGATVTVDSATWTPVRVVFTINEDVSVDAIGFKAQHILSGKTLLEYPQADYANLAFKAVNIEQVTSFEPVDEIDFDESVFVSGTNGATLATDVANTENNVYVYLPSDAKFGYAGYGSGVYFTTTYEGADLQLWVDVATDADLLVTGGEATNGQIRADGSTTGAGRNASRNAWTTVKFAAEKYNSGNSAIRVTGDDNIYGFYATVVDNIRVVDANGAVVATFDLENATNTDGVITGNWTNIASGYTAETLGTLTISAKSVANTTALKLVAAEDYYTVKANEVDGAAGAVTYTAIGEILKAGSYKLSASFKNNEIIMSSQVFGTTEGETGKNSAMAADGKWDSETQAAVAAIAQGYIAANSEQYYRYYDQRFSTYLHVDNNAFYVTAILTDVNGNTYESVKPVLVDTDWTDVAVAFELEEDTAIASVSFKAQHVLSGKTLLETPAADYVNVAFKNVEIVPFVCDHDYEGEFITEPTCADEGEMLYTCTVCGATYTETVPATGEHAYEYVVDVNDNAWHIVTCENCDYQGREEHYNGEDDECDYCGHVDAPIVDPTVYVAAIGDAQYETLAAAIEAAAAGAVIDLLTDAEAVTAAKAVTINKNGYAAAVTADGANYNVAESDDAIVVYPMIGSTSGASLLLKDMIQINYKSLGTNFTGKGFTQDQILANGKLLVWTGEAVVDGATYLLGTETETIDLTYESGSKAYVGNTDGIPARLMGDVQKYRFCITDADGVVWYSNVKEYSPKAYAINMYGKSTTSANDKALIVAMMNYGAAAQINFEYNTDDLMNTFLPEELQNVYTGYTATELKTDAEGKFQLPTTTAIVKNFGKSAVLKGAIEINIQLNMQTAHKNSELTLLYWTEETYNAATTLTEENATGAVAFDKSGSYPAALINGIPARLLGDTVFFCVKAVDADGNVFYSPLQTYSIHQYCVNTIGKTSNTVAVKNLAAAILVYSNAAETALGK